MSTAARATVSIPRPSLSKLAGWLVAGVALVVVPLFLPMDVQGIMTKFLIYAIFAISYDLVFGYTGLVSLGHAAFFGAGGYVVGVLSLRFGTNLFWLGMPIGIVVAVLTALLFGFISLRVSGVYFLLLTFALAQLLYSVAWNTPWLNSTGIQGIADISLPGFGIPGFEWTALSFYYFVLVIAVICFFLLRRVTASTFGHVLQGIREGEARMEAQGYNTWLFKYIAYVIAAGFAGVAGVLFAYYNRIISPAQFSMATSFYPMVMVILGGTGTLFGGVIGAALVIFIEYFASIETPERWPLILGTIFVFSILFFRAGLGVSMLRLWQKATKTNGNAPH
jgi:branched-chain amino acid transport system permease protein